MKRAFKDFWILVVLIIVILSMALFIYAADYHRVDSQTRVQIVEMGGVWVYNSHASRDYFIPVKSVAEQNAFQNAVNAGSVPGLCLGTVRSVTGNAGPGGATLCCNAGETLVDSWLVSQTGYFFCCQ